MALVGWISRCLTTLEAHLNSSPWFACRVCLPLFEPIPAFQFLLGGSHMDEACVGSGRAGNSGMQCFLNSSIAGMVLMTLLHGGQWVDSSPTVLRRKGPLLGLRSDWCPGSLRWEGGWCFQEIHTFSLLQGPSHSLTWLGPGMEADADLGHPNFFADVCGLWESVCLQLCTLLTPRLWPAR